MKVLCGRRLLLTEGLEKEIKKEIWAAWECWEKAKADRGWVTGRTCFLWPFRSLIGAFIGAFPIKFEASIFLSL